MTTYLFSPSSWYAIASCALTHNVVTNLRPSVWQRVQLKTGCHLFLKIVLPVAAIWGRYLSCTLSKLTFFLCFHFKVQKEDNYLHNDLYNFGRSPLLISITLKILDVRYIFQRRKNFHLGANRNPAFFLTLRRPINFSIDMLNCLQAQATAEDVSMATSTGSVIYLSSSEGQSLLESVRKGKGGLYQPILHVIFSKQMTPAGCGMQCCALLLSANRLGRTYSAKSFLSLKSSSFDRQLIPFTELTMYDLPQTLAVVDHSTVQRYGLTLSQVAKILTSHGCSVKKVHASHSSPSQFRADVVEALASFDSRAGVTVNFVRSKLGMASRVAHHSVLAAYHSDSDCVLVLDTGVEKEDFWVSINDLFTAMNTEDHLTKQIRGYCIAYK